jgi:hypothetical protein
MKTVPFFVSLPAEPYRVHLDIGQRVRGNAEENLKMN